MTGLTRRTTLTAALLAALAAPVAAWADDDYRPETPKISVSATGESEVAPDMASISLSVRTEQETARAALTENNSLMTQVLQSLKASGVAERDMQTSGLSINPRIVYPQPRNNSNNEAPKIVGYTVQNTLTARIRELSRVGAILDESVSLGVNRGGTLTFLNSDPSAAIERARIEAMTNAKAKAETLATAAGVELGRLLSIDEHSSRTQPITMMRGAMSSAQVAEDVPVASGENSYSVTVNAVWEITQ